MDDHTRADRGRPGRARPPAPGRPGSRRVRSGRGGDRPRARAGETGQQRGEPLRLQRRIPSGGRVRRPGERGRSHLTSGRAQDRQAKQGGMRGGYPRRDRDPSEGGLMEDRAVGAEERLEATRAVELAARILTNLRTVVHAPEQTLEFSLLCLLAEGHLIIEDFPGVGKTTLAKSLARSIDCAFSRLQFTPDLLPSDVTGVNVFNQRSNEFEFRPGPVFANVLLVDEINRASPKTQAALLECMQECQVTVDGTSYQLPPPFMVMATQNPIEYEGTYPLPEAELDRFTMRISIGYPPLVEEAKMLV